MKSLVRNINRKLMYRHFSASAHAGDKKMNLELCDIPTDIELQHDVEEVRIRLAFGGHLAGKWWNSKATKSIVCLHGWQVSITLIVAMFLYLFSISFKDNAGTFDRLIPMLPKDIGFLALDLPGHGLSSRVPDGMAYHSIDNLTLLNQICKEYNWDKISLMGHSMGSILSYMFASVFPDKVDMVIGIDALKPHVYNPALVAAALEDRVKNFMLADERNLLKGEPPCYNYEDMVERLTLGTNNSVTKETAQYLLKRNIKRSEKYPGKFYFTRDSRLKWNYSTNFPQTVTAELAKRLNMPYLFMKAQHSPYYERKEYFDEIVSILKESPKFEYHTVDATHHLHLTSPEKIAPIITNFINKHRNANCISKL